MMTMVTFLFLVYVDVNDDEDVKQGSIFHITDQISKYLNQI